MLRVGSYRPRWLVGQFLLRKSEFSIKYLNNDHHRLMRLCNICILLTLHCTKERVHEYNRSLAYWKAASGSFQKIITVDSANNQYINTTHALQMYHWSRSYGEKISILAAMPSLLDCPFIFKWTGKYYSDAFMHSIHSIQNMSSNDGLILQFRRDKRGQNSEMFGTTLDGMLKILAHVTLQPYVPMETALILHANVTTVIRLTPLKLNFVPKQNSRGQHNKQLLYL